MERNSSSRPAGTTRTIAEIPVEASNAKSVWAIKGLPAITPVSLSPPKRVPEPPPTMTAAAVEMPWVMAGARTSRKLLTQSGKLLLDLGTEAASVSAAFGLGLGDFHHGTHLGLTGSTDFGDRFLHKSRKFLG